MRKTMLSLLCGLVCLSPESSAIADEIFASETRYPAGARPRSVAIGDFNGDGHQDIAVVNENSDDVSVLLGYGDGSFAAQTRFWAGGAPSSLAAGDFDNDGHQDLVVTNLESIGSNTVSLVTLLGEGDGKFARQRLTGLGSAVAVTSAHLDDDGYLDLAMIRNGTNQAFSILGVGDGTFHDRTSYSAGDARSVAIGDFNGDGAPDLVMGAGYRYFWVRLGWQGYACTPYAIVPWYPASVAISDFDNDGHQDLAFAHYLGFVSVLLGNGRGGFTTPAVYPAGHRLSSIAIGDFDGDGSHDIAVTDSVYYILSVLLGDGEGGFAMPAAYPVGDYPLSIAVGDFDIDGKQDLAVANMDSNDISVLLNQLMTIIEIDITPEMALNHVKPNSGNAIAVAALGSDKSDVADIDVTSLRFGPGEAEPAYDLTDPWVYNESLQDVNKDGIMDLMSHYYSKLTGIACGDESATLSGKKLGNRPFEGTDQIRTVFPIAESEERLD